MCASEQATPLLPSFGDAIAPRYHGVIRNSISLSLRFTFVIVKQFGLISYGFVQIYPVAPKS